MIYDYLVPKYYFSHFRRNHFSQNENLTFKPQIAAKSTKFMKKSDNFLTRLEKDQQQRAEKTQELFKFLFFLKLISPI